MTPCGSVNLTEMVLEHPFRFLTLLGTSEMFVKPFDYLLRVCEILGRPQLVGLFWQLARLLKTELLLLVIIRHLHLRPSRSSVS